MYIKFAIPKIRTMIFPGIFRKKKDEVHYIGGAEVLPPPLAGEDEAVCIEMLTSDESGQLARKQQTDGDIFEIKPGCEPVPRKQRERRGYPFSGRRENIKDRSVGGSHDGKRI